LFANATKEIVYELVGSGANTGAHLLFKKIRNVPIQSDVHGMTVSVRLLCDKHVIVQLA
jgi:hypothetical protein